MSEHAAVDRMFRRKEAEAVQAKAPCMKCGKPVVEGDVMAMLAVKVGMDDRAMHLTCAP